MAVVSKTYLTFNKIRTSLFLRSYALYRITEFIKRKYKIKKRLRPKELKKRYSSKRAIPEISKLSRALYLPYKELWKMIMLAKFRPLSQKIPDRNKIKVYLSIEKELIKLFEMKVEKLNPFFDSDYDETLAILSVAVERAIGNKLINVKTDSEFESKQKILQKMYFKWYYKVAWKYKLPTMRIIPFILRLIT